MEDEKNGVNRIFWYTTEVPTTYVKNKDEKKTQETWDVSFC